MERVADWLTQAELDMKAGEDSATAAHHEWAAFQAQPSAGKAVKALVQSMHGAVRGHAVYEILRQLPAGVEVPRDTLDGARELDKVYLTSRYPNAFPSGKPNDYFTDENSRELISYAREILAWCRSQIH